MNKFFELEEYRRDFPRRAFARLDDIEPIVPGPDDALTFIFDAVDADWKGFRDGGPFDLRDPDLKSRIARFWDWRFRGGDGGPIDGPDAYDEVPIYRLEFSLSPDSNLFHSIPREEESWVEFSLSAAETDTPVDVYGGLFAPPTVAFLHFSPAVAPSVPLSILFDMKTWPDAAEDDLLSALQPQCRLESLVCFDIGQGSASALLCKCGAPIYYFDTGRGSGRNGPTAPAGIDFCTCYDPAVILSHWDTDHWAGAVKHARLQALNWVVPRQSISTTHVALANDILKAGGSIFVVADGAPPLVWSGYRQDYDLRRATGKKRNGTGLVLVVTDRPSGRSWVLTGDAGYNEIAQGPPADIAAMVAPHHGADMGKASVPFARSAAPYARLFYSFGPGNAHGPKTPPVRHPVAAAIAAHKAQNWDHGAWTVSGPGFAVAGADVLATAQHLTTHLKGAAVGWTSPPRSLKHLSTCADAMLVPQI